MTGSNEKIKEALDNIHENMFKVSGANIIGAHLEGPFLNCKYNGAQPVNHIKDIDVELVEKWNEHNVIKIITAAPELANFDKLLEYSLSNKIVLSIGHTGATYREAQNAVDLGVKNFTHAFNAMSGFNHRETGVVGAMLVNDDTYAELIPDGIHVCTSAVKLLYKAKGPNRIIIVTDAIRAKWLDDGISELGGQKVLNKEGAARLENGHLAGSVLKFNNGIKYINSSLELSLIDIAKMSSLNAAENLGIQDRKGSIKVGKDADIVVLDESFDVLKTIVGGKVCYEQEITN